LISPSEAYRESVRSAWPELAGKRVTAIPNGIDLDELGAPVQVETTEAETPFILSILHLVHYKGVDVLIRAFAALSAAFPTYRLKLVSDGPQRAEYEALTRSLGIAERVEFLGIQQRPQVATLLKDCTIFVLPSRSDSESFGIAVAEAMALDRPVIVSRVGGLPELVDDEATGLLVPPGDVQALEAALRRLLGDAPARRRLGAAGGRKVRANFLWSNTQSRYEAALRGVLAQA
jgi:glycosyltransferase involved in cell wall biosynthesis